MVSIIITKRDTDNSWTIEKMFVYFSGVKHEITPFSIDLFLTINGKMLIESAILQKWFSCLDRHNWQVKINLDKVKHLQKVLYCDLDFNSKTVKKGKSFTLYGIEYSIGLNEMIGTKSIELSFTEKKLDEILEAK